MKLLMTARLSRFICAAVALCAMAFTGFCGWRAVSDYRMQAREGWRYRCVDVQVAAVMFGSVGMVIAGAYIVAYRKIAAREKEWHRNREA